MSEVFTYLMQGDCLQRMKEIPEGYVDLVLCDLPYGTTACKWDTVIPFEQLWAEYKRICKGALVLFAQCPFDKKLGASNLAGLRYEWLWKKAQGSGSLNAKNMPLKIIENILVFYSKLPTYNPQMTPGKPYTVKRKKANSAVLGATGTHDGFVSVNEGTRYPTNLIEFGLGDFTYASKVHPTQKPVALMEYLIRTYTNEGMTVLDNCIGSGTTGVACVNTKRNFIGIEIDENYFAIATKRIEEAKVNATTL